MSYQIVRLQDAEYDCGLCGEVHTHNTSDHYATHLDYRGGPKRWIYKEVDSNGDH